jgi:hypothetical protein
MILDPDRTLRRFILADKPDWCTGLDVSVTIYLMTVGDADGRSSQLQAEIAKASGASVTNQAGLRRSIDRLHQHNWITMIKGGPAERHRYQVHFDKLPRKEEKHEQTQT